MPDLAVQLAGLRLKNPVICAAGEMTSTAAQLRAAVDAGAAAVVAKSANESEAARAQLAAAEYVTLDPHWRPAADPAGAGTSLMNRSGLVAAPFAEWLATLAAADAYAAERDAFVIASLIVADLERAAEMAAAIEAAGIRCPGAEPRRPARRRRRRPAPSRPCMEPHGRLRSWPVCGGL